MGGTNNSAGDLYPWLLPQWDRFAPRWQSVPHGLLVTGSPGIGKTRFTLHLASLLLCNRPTDSSACGQCDSCRLLAAVTHPDLHILLSEKASSETVEPLEGLSVRYRLEKPSRTKREPSSIIGVDSVRLLIENLAKKSHTANAKVVILRPAEALNINAANALLKILEEPAGRTYFLLVADDPFALPATIRSRCVSLGLVGPSPDDAIKWLKSRYPKEEGLEAALSMAGGAPLAAAQLIESGWGREAVRRSYLSDLYAIVMGQVDPLEAADYWAKEDVRMLLRWLQRALVDLLRIRTLQHDMTDGGSEERRMRREMAQRIGLDECRDVYRYIGEFLSWPVGAVDERLHLEDILIRVSALSRVDAF
jgi:DNA polymerase-3 subunit delta'